MLMKILPDRDGRRLPERERAAMSDYARDAVLVQFPAAAMIVSRED
jgi:hypothetical protein